MVWRQFCTAILRAGIVILIVFVLVEGLSIGAFLLSALVQKKTVDAVFWDKFLITRPLKRLYPLSQNEAVLQRFYNQKYIGNFSPESGSGWVKLLPPDSILGWRLARNVKCTHYDKYVYVTNSQGFILNGGVERYNQVKAADVYRIIVVGGSTVFGQGAYVPDENLPAVLQSRLAELGRKNVVYEVINAGVAGYFSGQEFLYLLTDLGRLHPDLIVVYDGWNDQNYNNVVIGRIGPEANSLKSNSHYGLEDLLQRSYSVPGSFSILCGLLKSRIVNFLNQFAFVALLEKGAHKIVMVKAAQGQAASGQALSILRSVMKYIKRT